ncbi:carbohydrate sulfotransferase 6-like [Palaemon carinicauda]|uniref:carbohydrate sulfotransferase 6-like n=1 Tax=Palaemon carinicauda TaxID=392227 RepID=UPI0035B6476F
MISKKVILLLAPVAFCLYLISVPYKSTKGEGLLNNETRVTNESAGLAKNNFPRIIILWTSWRSGSTYMGRLLASGLPDTFFSLEPLHKWQGRLAAINHENNTATSEAMKFIRGLLRCSIDSSYDSHVLHQSKCPFYLKANVFLYRNCREVNQCANTTFVNEICQRANIHVMKLLRLSLKWAWSLLEDDDLDLQIIYLARDPRAVLKSRSIVPWCGHKTCWDPKTVCSLLEDDLQEAKKIIRKFPKKFKFIQYEKVFSDLLKNLEDIMSFVGLKMSDAQRRIIAKNNGKNTTDFPSRWRAEADFGQVAIQQRECQKPLSELGLRIFNSNDELLNMQLPLVL